MFAALLSPALLALTAALLFTCLLAPSARAEGELEDYLARPDPSYAWREVSSGTVDNTRYVELTLTSQTWQGIPWRHQLVVFRPDNLDTSSGQALLYIDGGRWRPEYEHGQLRLPKEARIFARLAQTMRAPLAVVRQVPFQPIFERREDALIAYTFDQYLQTGQAEWPLLLPMVKSAARAMDAVQEVALKRWDIRIERFTVSGASKRGWTSWLTAAVDKRVASVAPMVIDMLNIPVQINLQRSVFGSLSEEVRDYEDINLPARIDSELGQRLLGMVDPYRYRERLTQQKLILLGTNDRYWPLEALRVYWGDLPDPKHVLYVPNQGHKLADYARVIATLSAFHRYSARGEPLPRLDWTFTRDGGKAIELFVSADRRPREVIAWTATSPTRDFREARWTAQKCTSARGGFVCRQPTAADRYSALYSEVVFNETAAPDFSLSTAVCVAGGPPSAQTDC